MGRAGTVDGDLTPQSILAFDPKPDLDLLITRLGRQADVWRQELEQQSLANAPQGVLFVYKWLLTYLQAVLNEVSESGRISSEAAYQKIAEFKKWAESWLDLDKNDPADTVFVQTRIGLLRTLLDILEEFV